MHKCNLVFSFKRYYVVASFLICLLVSISSPQVASAQTVSEASKVSHTENTTPDTNTANAGETVPGALDINSFADIAELGQEIALTQRKIQAMTLKNNLETLQAQQEAGNFMLKVVRVEGFNNSLYAVLSDENGIFYQVGPGDLVNKRYRVTLLRPYSVGVVDVNTNKFYTVPFVMGGMASAAENNINEESSSPNSVPDKQPLASSVAARSQ